MARTLFAIEFKTTERTPEGGEKTKSVGLRCTAIIVIAVAALLALGVVTPADIVVVFKSIPGWLFEASRDVLAR